MSEQAQDRAHEPAVWTDLLDPTPEQILAAMPPGLQWIVGRRLDQTRLRADTPDRVPLLDLPRPHLRVDAGCINGVFVVPVSVLAEDRIYYQVVRLVIRPGEMITIRTTPPRPPGCHDQAFDVSSLKQRVTVGNGPPSAGMLAYYLLDEIAERFLDLADDLHDELDDVEEHIEDWTSEQVRHRISSLRHDMLHIRRTLSPTRDALHAVIDNRLEVHDELFPREVEFMVSDAYAKMLRASEGFDLARDLLGSVRDYHQAKIAHDQNEVMKRLTAIASLLLVPTFIVGLYGQNFIHMPELRWQYGYQWSWFLILATTVGQLVYFRRKHWI